LRKQEEEEDSGGFQPLERGKWYLKRVNGHRLLEIEKGEKGRYPFR